MRSAVLLLAAAASACSDAPFDARDAHSDPLLEQVAALGLRADMVVDRGDHFLVEGDIKLNKRDLLASARRPSTDGPRFQYHTTQTVSNPAAIHQIHVDLGHLASHSGWYDAAVEALLQWNAVPNSYVRMVQGSPADITLRLVHDDPNLAGWAKFPSGGAPGDTVYLNASFHPGTTPTHAVYLRNAVHELGHAIGFRHTNWNSADCRNIWGQVVSCNWNAGAPGAHHIAGTPTSGGDANSVMNGLTAGQAWIGFSLWDRVATARLYPLPAPGNATVSFPGGTPTFSWQPVFGASYYRVRLWQYSQWYSPEYGSHSTYGYIDEIGTTTGTTMTDPSRTYTGVGSCYVYYPGADEEEYRDYAYSVEAVFSNGFANVHVAAPIGDC